ncbi:hypothetical protein CEV33_3282 [Brucella grignonensis]|uniref:Uncharacterized protein n=1 Tax=Brucella grignonensis TaxID=94627 RepID=A0A256F1U6_9HYPH|nr:hypothetical protein CEV33_3282 [Brucella grignonensis]
MPGQSLADKVFGSFQLSGFTKQELDRIAIAVDCAIQIKPFAFDLYVGLVEVPFPRDLALSPIEALKQLGAEMQNPAVHRRMVHRDTAFRHHLLQIAQTKIVSQIPSNTQEDDGLIEMAAFEHRTTQLYEGQKPISGSIDETFATDPIIAVPLGRHDNPQINIRIGVGAAGRERAAKENTVKSGSAEKSSTAVSRSRSRAAISDRSFKCNITNSRNLRHIERPNP